MKKPKWKSLRTKADRLLQQYITTKYQDCLVCGEDINCGHHFIPKSCSNALRYYIPNIIPICLKCHCRVGTQPWLVDPIIVLQKGSDWYEDLMREKKEPIKANWYWYQDHITKLEGLIKDLEMEKI